MQTLTLRCTLKPTPEQAAALEATVRLFADGCNHALRVAKEHGEFRRRALQPRVYRDLRAMGLSANLAIQAIFRVARKKGSRAKFYQATSCAFDQRTLSLRKEDEAVSLTTVAGRQVIPMKLGNYQRGILAKARSVQGGVLTKGPKGKWYIHLLVYGRSPSRQGIVHSLRVETPEPPEGGGRVVGVDLGQKVLATLSTWCTGEARPERGSSTWCTGEARPDRGSSTWCTGEARPDRGSSTGVQFSGGPLQGRRLHYLRKRAEVRSKLDRPSERTRGLKALWGRLRGREARFVNHTLHTLTQRIVDSLEPGDTLAIEDLTGLRGRTTKRGKEARHLHHLWPYGRFRALLEYKAALKGVRVVAVDPRHTSQECPRCAHTAVDDPLSGRTPSVHQRANRRSQALFRCQACGFQHNADWVAAHNIARRAGSMGMGRKGSGMAAGRFAPNLCKPAPILRVSSLHRLLSESPHQTA